MPTLLYTYNFYQTNCWCVQVLYEFAFSVTRDNFQLVTTMPRKVISCGSIESLSSVGLNGPSSVIIELTEEGHDVAELLLNVRLLLTFGFLFE